MESNAIADMVSTVMQDPDYLTRKLAHYNAWLGDTKRPLTSKYPGFPEEAPKAKAAAKPKGKKLTAVEQVEKDQAAAEMKLVRERAKERAKEDKKAAKAKPAKSTGGSKQDRAVEIYKEMSGDRKQTIQAIMERLGMSTAGATTYFYNAKKLAA